MITWQAGLLAAITLTTCGWALARYGERDLARTIALMSMVGVQMGQLFNCRSRTRSAFDGLIRSPLLFAASAVMRLIQLVALAFQPLRDLIGLAIPPASAWLVLILNVPLSIAIAIVELQKALARCQ